ncbi:MAG: AAA family ATPase [Candidatus Kapabacteria bacterium]|nr:AAA family ATPase [Ignavibacteriota bacterium]MCW5886222.1 AAA family ATPase [Candidatus Kapabacteria bacterium]
MEELKITDNTQKRLDEINLEIDKLIKERDALKFRWQSEKDLIFRLRKSKAEIEQLRTHSESLERAGELANVAEIRYGRIPQLENEIIKLNDDLVKVQKNGKLLKEEVEAEDIAEIVAKWTGIPVSRMLETERMKLIKMEDRIHSRVIGQKEAVAVVSNAIRRSRAGLQDENKPIGSFVFIGNTGVGKTELARSLAEFLFNDEHSMVRIDMSEYMEKFSVSRLIGAPPGYVGYEEGGQLTEAVRRKPYSVVLLDELEKAHSDVFNILLQLLDEGRLTDGKGRLVDFRNTIIIMTSNLGSEFINDKLVIMNDSNRSELMSEIRVKIVELLRKRLKPEFLNRIDEIVLFQPLTAKEIRQIADLQVQRVSEKLTKAGIKMEVTECALEWLSNLGYDAKFGARPLKRVVQKYVADPIAMKILSGEYSANTEILVDCDDNGKFSFHKK